MAQNPELKVSTILDARYGEGAADRQNASVPKLISSMLSRASCRDFTDEPVPKALLELICATALAAPTKSDLQQRDIILLHSAEQRQRLVELVSGQAWVANAPTIVIFCGNNRRQRLLHEWHGVPFANDHLDAFFNAVGDAAIALGAFVTAAEAVGLGCCPISAVRNEATAVSDLLGLPDHVFPFAGLALGFPKHADEWSPRLPLRVTCHIDRYQDDNLEDTVRDYDARRAQTQPYEKQRYPSFFEDVENYTWSEDKVRQYSQPERSTFGDFVRSKGFKLD